MTRLLPCIISRLALVGRSGELNYYFGPGSAIRLFRDATGGGEQLVCSLDSGMVQIDLRNRAHYSAMILRGATTETEILGAC